MFSSYSNIHNILHNDYFYRLRHLEAQIVGPAQFPVQNGQLLDKHGPLNINNKDQQPSSRMDRSGRTLDIVNGVDAVDMKDILDGVDAVDGVDVMDSVGNSASTNFLPKQISSSLSSGLSVGSVKVFLHASRRNVAQSL